MKKLSIFLVAVLLIASLFVSCDNSNKAVTDELVSVTFSTGDGSRSLSYSIEAVDGLDWFYSAQKNTSDTSPFNYGTTSGSSITLATETVTFSQGLWDFTLWAVRQGDDMNGTRVYQGSVSGVLITKENSPKTIVIQVSPEIPELQTGSIAFSNVRIKKHLVDEYAYATEAVIDGVEDPIILDESGSYTPTENEKLAAGNYSVTVKRTATINGTPVTYASETILVTVWSGRTTTISGDISELTGFGTINQVSTTASVSKTAVSGSETEFTVENVAPSNNAECKEIKNTTVVFAEGALDEGSYVLSLTVSDEVGNRNITVEDAGSGNVASIDLTLTKNNVVVSQFNENKTVTITTYIAKGLSGVGVTGPEGATITGVDYVPGSGKLVFTTNHFSEYTVTAAGSYEAYNLSSKKVYSSLVSAVNEAQSSDTMLLLANATVSGNDLSVSKNLTLNLGDKVLTLNSDMKIGSQYASSSGPDVTILNGEIQSSNKKIWSYYGSKLALNDVIVINTSGQLREFIVVQGNGEDFTNVFSAERCTFTNAGISIKPLGTGGVYDVTIKESTLSVTDIDTNSATYTNAVYVQGNVNGDLKIESCSTLAMSYENSTKPYTTCYFAYVNTLKPLNVSFKNNTFDLKGFALPYNFDTDQNITFEGWNTNTVKIDGNVVSLVKYNSTVDKSNPWITKDTGSAYDAAKSFWSSKKNQLNTKTYYLVEYHEGEVNEYYVGLGSSYITLNKIELDESDNVASVSVRGKIGNAKTVDSSIEAITSDDGKITIKALK